MGDVLTRRETTSPAAYKRLYQAATAERPYVPAKPFPAPETPEFVEEVRDLLIETRAVLRERFAYALTTIEAFHASRIARQVALQLHTERDREPNNLSGVGVMADEVIARLFDLLYGPETYMTVKRLLRQDELDRRAAGEPNARAHDAGISGALLPTQSYLLRLQTRAHHS